ncbi:hypothetical protein ACWD6R_13005 [Streptomyces sp. NPDC005151]
MDRCADRCGPAQGIGIVDGREVKDRSPVGSAGTGSGGTPPDQFS